MSFSYDENSLDVTLNRIRLEIGDTDSNRILLKDEEILKVIDEQTIFGQQVAECCKLIAALFARHPQNIKLEGFEETTTQIYDRYIKMAKRWEQKTNYPWAGSIEASYKETNELDTTLISPRFKLGMHNNDC